MIVRENRDLPYVEAGVKIGRLAIGRNDLPAETHFGDSHRFDKDEDTGWVPGGHVAMSRAALL
jgi:hypothetical protein